MTNIINNQVHTFMQNKVFLTSLIYVGLFCLSPIVHAQSSNEQELTTEQRLERLEKRLIAIESRVLGESQDGGGNSTLMADHEARLQALEAESSKIYGTAEEVAHAVERLAEKVDKMAQDYEMRLQDIEKSLESGSTPSHSDARSSNSADNQADDGGTERQKKGRNESTSQPEDVQPVPDDISANQLYNDAYEFMKKGSYAAAEKWFSEFTERHGEHNKAENAYYWLGEVLLVREKPQKALVAFGDSIKKFPSGARAADSLLKMGVAFVQIGKKELAQTTWQKLIKDFPESSSAQSAKKRLEELN